MNQCSRSVGVSGQKPNKVSYIVIKLKKIYNDMVGAVRIDLFKFRQVFFAGHIPGGGGGVLPYMGYIGMCGPKGYGFSAVLVHRSQLQVTQYLPQNSIKKS